MCLHMYMLKTTLYQYKNNITTIKQGNSITRQTFFSLYFSFFSFLGINIINKTNQKYLKRKTTLVDETVS